MSATTDKIQESYTLLLDFPFEEAGVQILVAVAEEAEAAVPSFEKMQITNEVAEEFRTLISREIRRMRKKFVARDSRLLKYDPAAMNRDDETEYLFISKEQDIGEQVQGVFDIAGMPVFTPEGWHVDNMRFYVAFAEVDGQKVAFMRLLSKANELSRSSWFGLRFSNKVFDKVEEPTFLFDGHVDCALVEDMLFIFNKNNFQRIFRYFERVKAAGRKALRAVGERVAIENFAAFSELCEGNVNMLAKLKNIAAKEYLRHVKMTDIKRVIQEFKLEANVVMIDGQEKLVFDANSKDKWLILRILDDDYLGSVMTKLKYEANSKRAIL